MNIHNKTITTHKPIAAPHHLSLPSLQIFLVNSYIHFSFWLVLPLLSCYRGQCSGQCALFLTAQVRFASRGSCPALSLQDVRRKRYLSKNFTIFTAWHIQWKKKYCFHNVRSLLLL